MKLGLLIATSLLLSAFSFAQAPDPRSIFDTGLASSLLAADTPPVSITQVRSAEGWGTAPAFASGSWVQLTGTNFTTNPFRAWVYPDDFNGNLAPTSLDGVSVSINGKPAYVYFISPQQINVEAPDDPAVGPVSITVSNNGIVSNTFTAQKAAVSPGLLAVNGGPFSFFVNGKQYLEATFGLQNFYVGTPNLVANFPYPFAPAKPGDVVWLYGIGFGETDPPLAAGTLAGGADKLKAPLTISFDQTPVTEIIYAGHYPTYTGLYFFAIRVPDVNPGDHQVKVTLDGQPLPQVAYLTTTR